MHTYGLTGRDFAITRTGRDCGLAGLAPGVSFADRLGVVVTSPLGGVGAAGLILAWVANYYQALRERQYEPPSYPGIYLFHVDRRWGDHSMLDVWPSRKEVVVSGSEQLVDAIEDRAISAIAVPDSTERRSTIEPNHNVRQRLRWAFAYDAAGRASNSNLSVSVGSKSAEWIQAVLDPMLSAAHAREQCLALYPYAATIDARAAETSAAERAECQKNWSKRLRHDWTTDHYRDITPDDVWQLLQAVSAS